MQDMMNLMSAIDNIKCGALIQPNAATGKIESILNKDVIVAKWLEFKAQLINKYDFIRDKKTRAEVDQLIAALDYQITSERSLIIDLDTKMFFDLFFDKYLVGKDDFSSPYKPNFNSQIFNDVPLDLTIQPMIISESPDTVEITRLSKLNKDADLLNQIEARYNERIKPSVGYKFSTYDFSFRTNVSISTKENLINEAGMTITEEIRNNVQVLTSYTLKRVEL